MPDDPTVVNYPPDRHEWRAVAVDKGGMANGMDVREPGAWRPTRAEADRDARALRSEGREAGAPYSAVRVQRKTEHIEWV